MTSIDVTAPGSKAKKGNAHVLSKARRELEDIFESMGFSIISGPEVEKEFYNFDALNVPKNHPARDMQDTFWVDKLDETVLRTHCTSVDIRHMQNNKPPIRVLAPGRVFRNEAIDATHEAQFHQWDGLVVGENISLANLKFILASVLRKFLNDDSIGVRLRPGFFPFVEPGVELDLTCFKCPKNNPSSSCNVCKGSGWIELLGAGMIHPNVLKAVGIDSKKYQALAFGPGLERLVMLKYGVDDIRDFYDGDIPFLKQF
ncbi:MAG: phenylalanine--tRNA ligase subunit alpha [Candidatus Pacebacteria bacterium]|nr:phenylalanine--tRNA ligase subunit alpha [Candidatus Paceibacterota bacterium]